MSIRISQERLDILTARAKSVVEIELTAAVKAEREFLREIIKIGIDFIQQEIKDSLQP